MVRKLCFQVASICLQNAARAVTIGVDATVSKGAEPKIKAPWLLLSGDASNPRLRGP